MMTKIVSIICFTLLALFSPKLTFACNEHQEEVKSEVSCETKDHHAENEHSCCEKENTEPTSKHQESKSSCTDSNCCCPMMANTSCCFYSNPSFEFHFNNPIFKEKISTLLVFQETSGYSSIFIPPKIA
ncbi:MULTISPECIES: hypothetical protein [Sphingobacterium]|mgnify:CR=1 FL=1|uniref:hypothetical protein n=1 Tax=Sphingobacterium TaxID=28453 RepID=UPI0011401F63|nr:MULTISPECIES: hypothetical protein [Sphingobacterium]MBA8988263.1 hypothetical protein [Sphingobacterium soli]WFB62482.1 hypothetical protein PZ892_12435 [Sphingobacterium sp. WM]